MNKNYINYFKWLLFSLLLTIGGCFGGNLINVPEKLYKALLIADLLLIVLFMFSKGIGKKIMFCVFCISQGLLLTPVINSYSNDLLISVFVITFIITCVFGLIGFIVKDLSFLGNILLSILTIFCIYGIASIFISLPSLSIIGVVLFSVYIAYDFNKFKLEANIEMNSDYILDHVMDMYLDILNLILELIELLGDNDD